MRDPPQISDIPVWWQQEVVDGARLHYRNPILSLVLLLRLYLKEVDVTLWTILEKRYLKIIYIRHNSYFYLVLVYLRKK